MYFFQRISWPVYRAISNLTKVLDKALAATFFRSWKPGVFMWWHFNGKKGCLYIRGCLNFHTLPRIAVYRNDTITVTYTIHDLEDNKFGEFAGTFGFDKEMIRQRLLKEAPYYSNSLGEAIYRYPYPEEGYETID